MENQNSSVNSTPQSPSRFFKFLVISLTATIVCLGAIFYINRSLIKPKAVLSVGVVSGGIGGWVGRYEFYEVIPPDVNVVDRLDIDVDGGAFLSISGHKTTFNFDLTSRIAGDGLEIFFDSHSNIDESRDWNFVKGDHLFTLRKMLNGDLAIDWDKLQPLVVENKNTFFKRVYDQSEGGNSTIDESLGRRSYNNEILGINLKLPGAGKYDIRETEWEEWGDVFDYFQPVVEIMPISLKNNKIEDRAVPMMQVSVRDISGLIPNADHSNALLESAYQEIFDRYGLGGRVDPSFEDVGQVRWMKFNPVYAPGQSGMSEQTLHDYYFATQGRYAYLVKYNQDVAETPDFQEIFHSIRLGQGRPLTPILKKLSLFASPVGFNIEVYGSNLNDVRGKLPIIFENKDGQKWQLPVDKQNTFDVRESCPSKDSLDCGKDLLPGIYKVYFESKDARSNELTFLILKKGPMVYEEVLRTVSKIFTCQTIFGTEAGCALAVFDKDVISPTLLNLHVDFREEGVLVAPDGKNIAVVKERQLYVINTESGASRVVANAPDGTSYGTYTSFPSFIPHARWVNSDQIEVGVFGREAIIDAENQKPREMKVISL